MKNETGLGSSSTGAVTGRSVGDLSCEVEEVGSNFASLPKRGPSGGEEAFSLPASIIDMVDAA